MYRIMLPAAAPCEPCTSFDPDVCPDRLSDVAEALMRGDEEQQRLAGELLRLAARLRSRAA